jgi:hypothetical protein
MANKQGLVDALCQHREILMRETAFLRREVRLRNLDTLAGKRAYLDTRSNSRYPWLAGQTNEIKTISFPYLVSSHEEALDFLLHELLLLRHRIQSLASIMREFSIPISSEKAKIKLRLMTRAFVRISQHIYNEITYE